MVAIRSPDVGLTIRVRDTHRTHFQPDVRYVFPSFCIRDLDCPTHVYCGFIPSGNTANAVAATIHRFGCEMPGQGKIVLKFKAFAKQWVIANLKPLLASEIPTFSEWIANAPYTPARKAYLTKVRAALTSTTVKRPNVYASKSFIKWETYPMPKNPRAINSFSDESKVILGPIFHAADKRLFEVENFVKGTDPKTWPERLRNKYGERPVYSTDYESFEAHHQGHYSEITEFAFMHLLRGAGMTQNFKRMIHSMIRGRNNTKFAGCSAETDERLFSGAMWTSSSNGVLNLLLTLFMALEARKLTVEQMLTAWQDITCDIEGDDGLLDASVAIPESLPQSMGLRLKYERHNSYGEASFCGIVTDGAAVVCDPIKVMQKFFTLEPRYKDARQSVHMSLLRAKALSYKYMFNDAPVVGELFQRVCDLTRSVNPKLTTEWKAWGLATVRTDAWRQRPAVSHTARATVEHQYGMNIEMQLYLEDKIRQSVGSILFPFRRWAWPCPDVLPAYPQHIPRLVLDTMAKDLVGKPRKAPGERTRQITNEVA